MTAGTIDRKRPRAGCTAGGLTHRRYPMSTRNAIPHGYCQCGCGQQTRLAAKTSTAEGTTKGVPRRYVLGHQGRLTTPEYVAEDRGFITPCWIWHRSLDDRGYGRLGLDGKWRHAHKVYYEAARGLVPVGLELDHLCRQHACVNPAHLEAVTHAENVRRGLAGAAQATRTICPRGHPYDDLNTYRWQGKRHCRACRAAQKRSRKAPA